MAKFPVSIFEMGVTPETSHLERRSIILSNYVSFILFCVNILILLLVPGNYNIGGVIETFIALLLFTVPFFINKAGFYSFVRVYLSWVPPVVVTTYMISSASGSEQIPASFYDGLRFYLLGCGCLPFLLFGKKDWRWLVISVVPSFTILLFCDSIFTWTGIGYQDVGIPDAGYALTFVRSFVSYIVISGSCFTLRFLVESSDDLNRELLETLKQKNIQLGQQAEAELSKVNAQLKKNLKELKEREFMLNESQRIARIGSWEYRVEDSFVFWSDEMYNIFGLDNNISARDVDLNKILVGDDAEAFTQATVSLLKNSTPYDIVVRAQTPFGHTKWIRVYSFPVTQGPNVIGVRGICHDITYFKEAENLLKDRENQYKSLFDQAFDPIIVTDLSGHLQDANTSFCKLMGYERGELLNVDVATLVAKDKDYTPIQFESLRSGVHVLSERRMVCKSGAVVEVEVSAKKFTDNRLMAIIRDVTELRKARLLIEESEARFRTAFENSAIGMAIISLEGGFVKVNEELCRIVGYAEEELVKLKFQNITYVEDIEGDLELFNETMRGERTNYQKEKRYVHRDGFLVWVNISVSLVRDNDGSPLYFVTQIENINKRKKAEIELIEAETKFRNLVERSLVGVYILKDGRYEYVNPAFAEIFGYSVAEILDLQSVEALVHEEDKSIVSENMRLRLSHEVESIRYDVRGYRKDGTMVSAEAFGSRIPYQGGNAIIGMLVDNTERKVREAELRDANKKIGELKLMALRSVMSPHFVFNVLNSIQFYIAKNDRLNAINYLSRFSKLMRSVLNHSVSNKIRLSEEVELLKNYIELEQTRFEHKFEYTIEIDALLSADDIEIPSLLIQPYVENAILHGLYSKVDAGELKIRIFERDAVIMFEIIDNGIGREEALRLRQQNFPGHKSMGIKLTEERLRLINENHNVSVEIQDLQDGGGPAGTKVTIGVAV